MKIQASKKVFALGSIALLGIGALGGAFLFPHTITHEVTKEVPVETIKEVPVEKIVDHNITVNVPVDNGKLAAVEQYAFDHDGNLSFVIDGLKDKDVAKIADRIILLGDFEAMAMNRVKSDGFITANKEVVNGITLYKGDLERLRLASDNVRFLSVDFDNKDADVLVPATFEQHGIKYSATFLVSYRNDAFYDIEVDSLTQS